VVDAPRGTLDARLRAALVEAKQVLLDALAGAAGRPQQSPSSTAWPPRQPALASWPQVWRQAWGIRTNHLEDVGMSLWEAERQAFLDAAALRVAVGLPLLRTTFDKPEEPDPQPSGHVFGERVGPPAAVAADRSAAAPRQPGRHPAEGQLTLF
jgi:hypothetical protein